MGRPGCLTAVVSNPRESPEGLRVSTALALFLAEALEKDLKANGTALVDCFASEDRTEGTAFRILR